MAPVSPVYAANAVMTLAALAACVWHASPDRDRLAFLGTGVVYGVLLEQLIIVRFEAYYYAVDHFLLVVADVPLVVGFGWATIIYAGYEVGRRFDLSARALPAFVALFALHIDLAIDAVAIRIPFWTWTRPGVWFGVPIGNFVGWYLVASLFTAGWLALRDRAPSRLLVGVGTVAVAVFGLVTLMEVYTAVATTTPRRVAVLGLLLAGSLAVVVRDDPDLVAVDPRIAAVPLLYHGFYLAVLLALGMYRDRPLMLVVSLAMLGLGGAVHAAGEWQARRSAVPG